MDKLDAVGFVIGGTALIVFHSTFTAVFSATQRVLRKEGYSSKERRVSDRYSMAIGVIFVGLGLLELFGVAEIGG